MNGEGGPFDFILGTRCTAGPVLRTPDAGTTVRAQSNECETSGLLPATCNPSLLHLRPLFVDKLNVGPPHVGGFDVAASGDGDAGFEKLLPLQRPRI